MPTPLLETRVRADWQKLSQVRAAEGARIWRIVQLLVLAVMLVTLVAAYLPHLEQWQVPLHILTLTMVFWLFPIRLIARTSDRGVGLSALVLTASILVAFSAPESISASGGGPLPAWAAIPAPFVVLGILILLPRIDPHAAAQLGLRRPTSWSTPAVGAATGIAFGLHFWFVIAVLPGQSMPALPRGEVLLWLCCWIALRAIGEELLFRGAAFYARELMGQGSLLRTAALLALVGLFVHIVPTGSSASGPLIWLIGLLYTAALAMVMTFLRARERSLASAGACNFLFSLLFVGVIWT